MIRVVGSSPTEGFACNSWVVWLRGDGRSWVGASTSPPRCVRWEGVVRMRIARICGMARVVDPFRGMYARARLMRTNPGVRAGSRLRRTVVGQRLGRSEPDAEGGAAARPAMPPTSPANEGDVGPSAAQPTGHERASGQPRRARRARPSAESRVRDLARGGVRRGRIDVRLARGLAGRGSGLR
jgi:hypothetical protein